MDGKESLKKLGFTEYESKAYVSLAKFGPLTVRDLVLHSGIPRNKAYAALEKLSQKNHVSVLNLSPRKYKIINPYLLKDEVEDIFDSVDELIKLANQSGSSDAQELFWIIKGKNQQKINLQYKMKIQRKKYWDIVYSKILCSRMLGS